LVRIIIDIGTSNEGGGNVAKLNFQQKFAKSLTGNVISNVRIIVSVILLLISLAVVVTLIYSSVYGTIISMGRNPLAKNEIYKSLAGVLLLTSFLVLITSLTEYLLLR